MVGLKYNTKTCQTFYISIECIVAFHVNMLQQLHLPVNSIICKQKKIPSNLFNLFNIANNNINSTSKLKRKLD